MYVLLHCVTFILFFFFSLFADRTWSLNTTESFFPPAITNWWQQHQHQLTGVTIMNNVYTGWFLFFVMIQRFSRKVLDKFKSYFPIFIKWFNDLIYYNNLSILHILIFDFVVVTLFFLSWIWKNNIFVKVLIHNITLMVSSPFMSHLVWYHMIQAYDRLVPWYVAVCFWGSKLKEIVFWLGRDVKSFPNERRNKCKLICHRNQYYFILP